MNKLAIIIPTRNRPHKIVPLVENIQKTTTVPHKIYFAVCENESKKICEDNGYNFIWSDLDSFYKKINELYHHTKEPYIFTGSDDYLFYENWDTEALNHDKGLIGINDVHHALYPAEFPFGVKCGSSFIIKRELADKIGEIFHEGYRHSWADVELIKKAGDEFVYEPNSIVEHLHWVFGLAPHDQTYIEHEKENGNDYNLYLQRNG